MRFHRYILQCCVLLVGATSSFALELGGVTLPDSTVYKETELVLNGGGIRTVTFLKIKVYVAGLYLTEKNSNPAQIVAADEPRQLLMHFVRGVSAEKLRNGWRESFARVEADHESLKDKLATFNGLMVSMEEDKKILLTFLDSGVAVAVDGSPAVLIAGREFSRALLSIWLGQNPPNESLKRGLLGDSK